MFRNVIGLVQYGIGLEAMLEPAKTYVEDDGDCADDRPLWKPDAKVPVKVATRATSIFIQCAPKPYPMYHHVCVTQTMADGPDMYCRR